MSKIIDFFKKSKTNETSIINKLIKKLVLLLLPALIAFVIIFVIAMVVINSVFAVAVGTAGEAQKQQAYDDTEESEPVSEDNNGIVYIKNNVDYADDYLAYTQNNILRSYKRTGKVVGYTPLFLYVNHLANTDKSSQEAYNDAVQEWTEKSDKFTPFSMPIDLNNVTQITSFWSQQRGITLSAGNVYYDNHNGWDLAAPARTPVYAPADNGTVIKVSFPSKTNTSSFYSMGNNSWKMNNEVHIQYEYNGKKYVVVFAHLYPNSAKVSVGDVVSKGQEIAEVGTTGASTGNHLHISLLINNSYKSHTDFFAYVNFNNGNSEKNDDDFDPDYYY